MWDLENLGILDKNSVHDDFVENILFDKGRYTVRLPFRKHHDTLPDNFDLSVTRLNSLVRCLKKSPELATEYSKVIEDQKKQGIIEEFNPFLEKAEVGKTHYFSHHAVIRQDALTTKVRVVFDGSAQCDPGLPSLNDILETGPSTVPAIFDILLCFRSYKIPLVADIAQAFHQICVSSDDINCLRFLWVNDLNAVEPEIVFMRFLRVVFGLLSSPFLLGGTWQHHIKRYQPDDPAFVEKLLKSLYVDDLTSGSNSVKEAFELFLKSKACLSEASFHLRKWASSSKELMSLIQMSEATQAHDNPIQSRVVEDQSTFAKLSIAQLETLDGGESKVLGHLWNRSEDTFIFKFDKLVKIAQALSATKRNVLKIAASVYDPLGILSPMVVKMKVLLQEACYLQYAWDTPLPDELARIWRKWIDDLEKIKSIEVEIVSHALHGFADASLIGYCSVVYLVY